MWCGAWLQARMHMQVCMLTINYIFQSNSCKDRDRPVDLKPMSPQEERQMEEAIAKVTEMAQRRVEYEQPENPPQKEQGETGSYTRLFGVKKSSPTTEKRSFREEIEQKQNKVTDEVSVQGQEAYNVLVVKGQQDKHREDRERRIRRALQHQQADSKRNANIREPQGIPTLASQTNPLRRLREATVPQRSDDPDKRLSTVSSSSAYSDTSPVQEKKMPPVPPRKPLRPGTINAKPRERKYPLDLGGGDHVNGDEPEGDTGQQPVQDFPSLVNTSQFCVKLVSHSAEELGLNDSSDSFWTSQVDFTSVTPDPLSDSTPTFQYKTENVSYEDLLEFALDADDKYVCFLARCTIEASKLTVIWPLWPRLSRHCDFKPTSHNLWCCLKLACC